ncbi:MAG: bstEII [Bacillota bacterium]|nr:bstEII [Bacillota bacterium]
METKSFRDFREEGKNWITLSTGEYYPDILVDACNLYEPVLVTFSKILESAESSEALFRGICEVKNVWMRVQLARVFRKYVSPETPVEMLKKKTLVDTICEDFGGGFRAIQEVQKAFDSRPIPDEALCAVLWEYKDRGKKGYDLTEKFFKLIKDNFKGIKIIGPKRAGRDIRMKEVFSDYPNPERPVDFVLSNSQKTIVYAIGLARYDGDRGGAQEDDRTGGYVNCADEIINYANSRGLNTKVIFLNDGPGLLLGSMWNDYSSLEERWPNRIKVVTLRMVKERISEKWLRGEES